MDFLKKNSTLILTIILAVAAAVIIYFSVKAMSPTTPVVVANQNLGVGTVISKEHLTTRNFPANNIPSTAFSFPNDVIGKTIINGPIVQGDMVRSEHLSMDGSLMSVLKTYAPEGWTAIALPGENYGMQGIKKGDKVNVYGEIGSAQGIIVSELVKDAVVLSVADSAKNPTPYIIAVPDNYAAVVAEVIVRNKPITITLPSEIEQKPEDTEKITEEVAEETTEEATKPVETKEAE